MPMLFGTNTPNHHHRDFRPFRVIYSGTGEWSDRLISLLKQVETEYVWYFQEDHWLTDSPPDYAILSELVNKNGLFRLQISPILKFYTLYGEHPPFFFNETPKSKYLCCHQPSIWNKDFLLSCLQPNETPWENEYKATCRLWARTNEIRGKIAILPYEWYDHVGIKGRLVLPKVKA
jgi:hypothetical protein